MTKIRMFNVRGLLGGAGFEFSEGMDELTVESNKIEGVSATTEGDEVNPVWGVIWNLFNACMMAFASGRQIVLVGHSYGGFACLVVASMLAAHGVMVRLLVCVDTTIDSPPIPDTHGVRWVYFQKVDPMGGGNPDSVPNASTPVRRIQLAVPHIEMAKNKQVHSDIAAELIAITKS